MVVILSILLTPIAELRPPLCVTVRPYQTLVQAEEEFEVGVRVVNSSNVPQSFYVLNRFTYPWRSDTPSVNLTTWPCCGNERPTKITLMPGESYGRCLVASVKKGTARTVPFRIGFSFEGGTYWSNPVTFRIIDREK